MESINIIMRRQPYGSVDASEAIRHAMGGATNDIDVKLILLDGAVQAARNGQNISDTEYQSIEEGIKDCIDMGVAVYADEGSLREERIEAGDLIDGVKMANGPEIAALISECGTTMIF
jgi:predicted peroxiredoxin